jgi:type I restriction enzyme S subunit
MYSMQRSEVRRWADDHRHGVGRPRLGLRVIRQIPVPLPPLSEQRRIVDILEDHLSRLDTADVGLARSVAALDVVNQSVLSRIRRSLIASSAPVVTLGEACDTSLGKMLDAKRSNGAPTPYLRNINVRWGRIDLSDVKTVPLTQEERLRLEVKPGDLLVCEGGEPGRCAVWSAGPEGMAYQKALHRVRVKDASTVASRFVALMLEEFVRAGRADHMFTGTTIRHLPQERLRLIEIPIPEMAIQRSTVDRVAAYVEATARARSELGRVASEGKALRRSLLAAAFSGRLTGRSSDVELIEEMAGV